jgi:hypothetical protein
VKVQNWQKWLSCAYCVDCPGTNSGWNKVTLDGFSESDFINADTGFKSALFQKRDRYVLAFTGTDGLSDWGDIKANITQALGMDTK